MTISKETYQKSPSGTSNPPTRSTVREREAIANFTSITNEIKDDASPGRFTLTEVSNTKLAFVGFSGWYIYFTFTWKDAREAKLLLAVVKDWAMDGTNRRHCSKEAWAFLSKL